MNEQNQNKDIKYNAQKKYKTKQKSHKIPKLKPDFYLKFR